MFRNLGIMLRREYGSEACGENHPEKRAGLWVYHATWNARRVQIWEPNLKNRKILFSVDQHGQPFIWFSRLETLKADRRKIRNKIRKYFLGVLQVRQSCYRIN